MFSKKKSGGMPIDKIKLLDKRGLKYVTERDSETFRENRLGSEGAINVTGGEFTLVCGGKNVMRCDVTEVTVAELMNLSGITVKGYDKDEKREKSVIAYFSEGKVGVSRR